MVEKKDVKKGGQKAVLSVVWRVCLKVECWVVETVGHLVVG